MTRKVTALIVEDSAAEFFKRAHEHARALDRGEALPVESTIIFEDPAALLAMLTADRKNLLHSLRDQGASPISELADRLGRNKRAVSRDVSAMRACGLVRTTYVTRAGHGRNLVVTPVARRLELRSSI